MQQQTGPDTAHGGLPGAQPQALALGRITDARIRPAPRVPSWALKVVMALTGVVFALFLLAHMVGNLKIFTGAEHLNAYAVWLRTAFEPLLPYEGLLWIMRIALLVCLVGHVWAAVLLTGRAARSRGGAGAAGLAGAGMRLGWRSFAARTMPVTGVVLLGFVVFHLLDLTTGTLVASADYRHLEDGQAHAYENVVASFSRPWASAVYVVTLLVLLAHLTHGLWTVVQDLGVTGRRSRAIGVALAGAVPLLVVVGNLTIPVAVLTGVLE